MSTDSLRNEMMEAFNEGKKYVLCINRPDGYCVTVAGASPSLLANYMAIEYGADGIKSFVCGNSNIYEIRNDHPTMKDGWCLNKVDFSLEQEVA
jgi:hypothetical protein